MCGFVLIKIYLCIEFLCANKIAFEPFIFTMRQMPCQFAIWKHNICHVAFAYKRAYGHILLVTIEMVHGNMVKSYLGLPPNLQEEFDIVNFFVTGMAFVLGLGLGTLRPQHNKRMRRSRWIQCSAALDHGTPIHSSRALQDACPYTLTFWRPRRNCV